MNFEILTLLQGGTTCLVSLVKIQNHPIWIEGGVVFQRNLEYMEILALLKGTRGTICLVYLVKNQND